MRLYCPTSLVDGCSFYRCLQPAAFDPKGKVWTDVEHCPDFAKIDPALVILQRLYKPEHLNALLLATQSEWKVIYDLDDDIFHIPENNPAAPFFDAESLERAKLGLRLADLVTVSTARLAETVRQIEPQIKAIEVIPNRIDPRRWPAPQPRGDEHVVIAWAGSVSHYDDLMLVAEALAKVVELRPHIVLAMFGYCPKEIRRHTPRLMFEPWTSLASYGRKLSASSPDIAILPLTEHPFNITKSDIKYLEFSLLGAATVASPVGPYADAIPANEERGLLATNTDEWIRQLVRLIDDAAERRALAANAKQWVLDQRAVQHDWPTRQFVYDTHFPTDLQS